MASLAFDHADFNSLDFYGRYSDGLISHDAFCTLLPLAKTGDEQAMRRILLANIGLIHKVSRYPSILRFGLSMDTIMSYGHEGLMVAVDKFDLSTGNRFSTYAMYWVRQSIERGCERDARTIRFPTHVWKAFSKKAKAEREGVTLSDDELPPLFRDRKHELFGDACVSWDQCVGSADDDDGQSMDAWFVDNCADTQPDEILDREQKLEIANAFLSRLDKKSADIIVRRFGLSGDKETLDSIGEDYGISRERVRQIEAKAVNSLKLFEISNKFSGVALNSASAEYYAFGTGKLIKRKNDNAGGVHHA